MYTIGELKNVTVIVVTGGPCGGKTTGLSLLSRKLSDRGYKVLISPESATKLISAGMIPGELQPGIFQRAIYADALQQEEGLVFIARQYAAKGRKVVVLCDRGMLDGAAYVSSEIFAEIMGEHGHTWDDLGAKRYHAVMHMQTTAIGAEEHYTLANNSARIETPEKARLLDGMISNVWLRHPHPRIIDNATDFDGKLNKLLAEVCGVLGDPVPIEKEEKFLLEGFDQSKVTVSTNQTQIVQDYLLSSEAGVERRLRARTNGTSATYYYTIKRKLIGVGREEKERIITPIEYHAFLESRDLNRQTIIKNRTCFFWNNRFFEVDEFVTPFNGLVLLEVEYTEENPDIEIPPFLKVKECVTGNPKYSNAELAKY